MEKQKKKSPWMEITLERQLSDERDFATQTETKLTYGVLCGHRMGSNLLTESLYLTGVLGDPMEYFNARWLAKFREKHGQNYRQFEPFMNFIKSKRTSPNGVFGYNLKVDQLKNVVRASFPKQSGGKSLLGNTDKFVFLRRRGRLDQAISDYIGKAKDTFRIPKEANVDEIHSIIEDVSFRPVMIMSALQSAIEFDRGWEQFLEKTSKPVLEIYYEDVVADFEGSIKSVAEFLTGNDDIVVPEPPTAKIAGAKNLELKQRFLEYIGAQTK